MNMKKPQEPENDLEAEYRRLSGNEKIYLERIDFWDKLQRSSLPLMLISLFLMLASIFLLPEDKPLLESFPDYPLQFSLMYVGLGSFLFSIITFWLSSSKTSKISDELRLHREERLYLRAYKAYKSINSYLDESNPKRKPFLKKLALKNAEKMTRIVDGWKYGNIKLIRNLVGDQIDLLKNNMKRLVLSNVARGDEMALRKISEIIIEFCKHIHSPSVEKLCKLNDMIKDLPYKEYKVLTKQEKIGEFFQSKPRALRLLFASCVTVIVALVLLYLGQNIGVIFAVGVTCFWGAFTGFDKLFRLEKK